MSPNFINRSLAAVVLSLAIASPAGAQSSLGVRANGMGGAFVGVADDATAVYWNPAGLATGAIASLNLEFGGLDPLGMTGPALKHALLASFQPGFSLRPVILSAYTSVRGRSLYITPGTRLSSGMKQLSAALVLSNSVRNSGEIYY